MVRGGWLLQSLIVHPVLHTLLNKMFFILLIFILSSKASGFQNTLVVQPGPGADQPHGYDIEDELIVDLFKDYNKWLLPTENDSIPVTVTFGLSFVQLLSINEQKQVMNSNIWLTLTWRDFSLQWDPSEYGGVGVRIFFCISF